MEEHSYEEQEGYYILQLGVVRLIYLALTCRPSFDVAVVSFPRQEEFSKEVLELVSELGMIQHGRRVAQSVSAGLAEILESPPGTFTITLPEKVIDHAGHERDVLEGFIVQSRRQFSELLRSELGQKLGRDVDKRLAELVKPWATHFIQYDTDELLDEYFFGLAFHEIQLQEGFDSYHFAIGFGGVRFQSYILALTFVLSIFLRHEKCAEALVRKSSSTRLENVLTITSDVEAFVADLRAAVNHFGSAYDDFKLLDEQGARTVFAVLSCGRHCAELVAAPGSPIPPIVQSSDQGFIRCLAGGRSEPVRYLLEALRFHFPQDYDRNQRSREGSMQRAVKRVLSAQFEGLEFRENLHLRASGRVVTDIDLVVIEPATGVVLLCQLKHQDLYGFNLHTERIRGERLVRQARDWVIAVDRWMEQVGSQGLRRLLRMSEKSPDPQPQKLVVAKHFAHQLRVLASTGALYANWPQLLLAASAASKVTERRGLIDLVNRLLEIPSLQSRYEHEPEGTTRWRVGSLTFMTQQPGS